MIQWVKLKRESIEDPLFYFKSHLNAFIPSLNKSDFVNLPPHLEHRSNVTSFGQYSSDINLGHSEQSNSCIDFGTPFNELRLLHLLHETLVLPSKLQT
jgi:hypothetical protein